MKKLKNLNFWILLSITISCAIKKQYVRNSKTVFEIHFQDKFLNNITSLYINEKKIFFDKKLSSSRNIGLTDMIVKFQRLEGELYFFLNESKGNKIKLNLENILIKVIIDGKESKHKVILNKGRYLGFSKEENNGVKLIQFLNPFQYD